MIDSAFLWRLLLSFLVGGGWIAAATLAADRLGSRIGGFLSGLPSTVVVTFFFIGLGQGTEAAAQATTVFPMAFAVTGLFLLAFAVLSRGSFAAGFSAALVLWVVLSALILILKPNRFGWSLAVYAVVLAASIGLTGSVLRLPKAQHGGGRHSPLQVAARAVFGGLIIVVAVLLSRIGGPVFGGVFAGFPAVFVSTLVIGFREHGLDFARAIVRPMLLTGMITIGIYGIGVRLLYPVFGLIRGTVLSFLLSLVAGVFVFILLRPQAGGAPASSGGH
ncbi:MAG: DUF3147 family protein [Candidatus Aminicenantes bacterium]|nr:DUF3147 family protein [Candidatus Aminicenantes bacterium]